MPVIAIIAFIACVVLLFLLMNALANRKQIKAAYEYGKKNFDIELPQSLSVKQSGFHNLSDAEAFFYLIAPYINDLNQDKKEHLQKYIEDLKSNLKVNNEVYDFFVKNMNDKKVT